MGDFFGRWHCYRLDFAGGPSARSLVSQFWVESLAPVTDVRRSTSQLEARLLCPAQFGAKKASSLHRPEWGLTGWGMMCTIDSM
jgi:hypothetical protein